MEGKKLWGNAVMPTRPWVTGLPVCTPGPGNGGEASGRMASFSAIEPLPLLLGGDMVSVHKHPRGWGAAPPARWAARETEITGTETTPAHSLCELLIDVPDLAQDRACPISRPSPRQPRSSPGKRLSLPTLSESKNPFRRTL